MHLTSAKSGKIALGLLATILFMISLGLPGIIQEPDVLSGYDLLLYGWFGILSGILAWYANLFVVFALMALWGSPKLAVYHAGIAVLLALQCPFLEGKKGMVNSMDTWSDFGALASGYYVWQASLFALFALCLWRHLDERRLASDSPT